MERMRPVFKEADFKDAKKTANKDKNRKMDILPRKLHEQSLSLSFVLFNDTSS